MENLTIAYMFTSCDREDWRDEMLRPFHDRGMVIVEFPGIIGKLAEARCAAFDKITTDYFVMIDPDDRADPDVILEAYAFLLDNPDYAACGVSENSMTEYGLPVSGPPIMPFSFTRFTQTPLELHNGTVVKTSAVREFIPKLLPANFYSFDWALRLCISYKYKVHKLQRIGYTFRRKEKSHHTGLYYTDGMVPARGTVDTLVHLGLIKRENPVFF